LTETTPAPQSNLGGIVSNTFGEQCLFTVNRNAFKNSDASTVFRSHFGDSLFQENTFYVIAGTDSGLLYQFIKAHGVPSGSRYLFVELPQILEHLVELDDPDAGLAVTTEPEWMERATDMDMFDYAIQNRLFLHRSLGVVHGHYGEYPPFWRRLKHEFDNYLNKQQVGINGRVFSLQQIANMTENQIPTIFLKDKFKGKTAVLLAGGPSLDDLLPWVKQHRDNLLVIAVSRISQSLLQAGIQPDICVSVDPYLLNFKVSREMLDFQQDTLLVNEYHLNSTMLSSWGGKKAYMGPRYPWATPLEPENLPPSIGATVTNTAFTLAMDTGVAQIILGGADFCHNQTGYTHAKGSAEHALGPSPMCGDTRVETNSGLMADTTYPYLNSARTLDIQTQLAHEVNCRVINPAPGAMRLPHVEHIPANEIQIEPLEKPARETIAASLPPDDNKTRTRLYHETLAEVDRVLEELRNIKSLSQKALEYNRRLFDKSQQGAASMSINDKLNKIESQINNKYASTANFVKTFGLRRFVLSLGKKGDNKEDLEESTRISFLSFVDTADELIELLRQTRRRILSRLEEEKPQPDIDILIEQWRRDKQPGRAIYWVEQHTNFVSRLTHEQQQALREFQATFEEDLKEVENEHIRRVEQIGVNLDGLNGRAREYFQCRDEQALQGVLSSLKEHRDREQAELLLPLVAGYLAELHGQPSEAIQAYQKINEGPAQIDALMRLFELHINNFDTDLAVQVLKTLSEISPVYTPMYADMLQARGEVETAVEIYTNYLLDNPDDLDSVMKLGKIYYQHDARDGVEWAMNYILSKEPDNRAAKAMLSSLDQTQATGK
jgi:tetratricopeptide (TPR) repeat protein